MSTGRMNIFQTVMSDLALAGSQAGHMTVHLSAHVEYVMTDIP